MKNTTNGYTNVGIEKEMKDLLNEKRGDVPLRRFLASVLRSAAAQRGWIKKEGEA